MKEPVRCDVCQFPASHAAVDVEWEFLLCYSCTDAFKKGQENPQAEVMTQAEYLDWLQLEDEFEYADVKWKERVEKEGA